MPDSPLQRIACVGGSLLAILFLVALYSGYALDFPRAGQWDFLPFFDKAFEGTLSVGDFWAQLGVDRPAVPRLVLLALARASDWDVRWELAANFVLALLVWGVLCLLARRSAAAVHDGHNLPVYLLFTLLVFSLSQWANWFLGSQVAQFLTVLAVILALAALSWGRGHRWGIVLAALFGAVATYSTASGVLVWPVGLILLVLQRSERGPAFRWHAGAWCAAAGLLLASWGYGYTLPETHAPIANALGQPVRCVLYALAYLGQPVGRAEDLIGFGLAAAGQGSSAGDHTFSILMGALGLLLWGVSLVQLVLYGAPKNMLLPWVGLALHAIGTACVTALGRVDDGFELEAGSRYVTTANLLWVAVAAQTFWVGQVAEGTLVRRMLPVKIGILCAALVAASLAGAWRWTAHHAVYETLREDVRSGTDPERLEPIYPPDPAAVIERRAVLERHGLGIFR